MARDFISNATATMNVRIKLTTRILVGEIADREDITLRDVVERAILNYWAETEAAVTARRAAEGDGTPNPVQVVAA